MVKYLKKEIILKNGNIRNYYSKLYKNGKIIKITKKEYINHVGGTNYLFNELNKNVNKLASNINSNSGINSDIIFISWFRNNEEIISKLLEDFDINGKLNNGQVTATTFNDFYKWSMLPVIRYIEKCQKFENKNINVTFSVNIRSNDLRNKLIQNKSLQDKVNEALKSLSERYFDRNIFKEIINLKKLNIDNDTIDLICGLEDSPRKLIDRVIYEKYIPTEETKDDVVVSFFKANDTKIGSERIYIEATGPWHKVTWLETTLMQCVYEVLLRDKLENNGITYTEWLLNALRRCSRSVEAIKKLENGNRSKEPLKGALFTGRRTGGFAFLLLQNMFIKDNYKNCIGTSSVDAWYKISLFDKNKTLVPIGTHAHELSMVMSTLLPDIDDYTKYPLSQLVSHYLYFLKSIPNGLIENKSLMPMLPDTLGTESFVRAASLIKIPEKNMLNDSNKKIKFLDIFGSARQDSGDLNSFVEIMNKYNFNGSIMASEIDNIETLEDASKIKKSNGEFAYKLFGAGGFFGDSEAAWNKSKKNISMAVKPTRIFIDFNETNIKPVKLGNSNSSNKLEVNGLLSNEESNKAKKRAINIKSHSKRTNNNKPNEINEIQYFFDNELRELGISEKITSNNKLKNMLGIS